MRPPWSAASRRSRPSTQTPGTWEEGGGFGGYRDREGISTGGAGTGGRHRGRRGNREVQGQGGGEGGTGSGGYVQVRNMGVEGAVGEGGRHRDREVAGPDWCSGRRVAGALRGSRGKGGGGGEVNL